MENMPRGPIDDESVQKVNQIMQLYYRSANIQDVGLDLKGENLKAFNLCKRLHNEVSSILRLKREESEKMKKIIVSKLISNQTILSSPLAEKKKFQQQNNTISNSFEPNWSIALYKPYRIRGKKNYQQPLQINNNNKRNHLDPHKM